MEKSSKPKLLTDPVTDPAAKKLARTRLYERAASITLAKGARKAAKKRRRQAP